MNKQQLPPYMQKYNYLTNTISRKTDEFNAMPYNPYMMGNFGNGMSLPIALPLGML